MRTVDYRLRRVPGIAFGCFALIAVLLWQAPAHAEIKIVEADYTYTMGANDNRVDARRIAVRESKRKALEEAGTYLASLSEVKDHQLTKDEVKAYAAGLLETEIVADEMRGTAGHPELYIRTRSTIDTRVLTAALERLRDNEDLKEQVKAAVQETKQLTKERDALVKQLGAEKNAKKAGSIRGKLDTVLTKEETNEETDRIWATVPHACGFGDEPGPELSQEEVERSTATLERIVKVNPGNQRALYLLAALYQRSGNYAAAENHARTAIKRNPSKPAPHMKLGVLLHNQGRNKEALQEFHFVERLRPHNALMLYYTGMTLKDMRRCGPAVQYLQRFLKNKGAARYPVTKQHALQGIQDCGGARGGYQRRITNN